MGLLVVLIIAGYFVAKGLASFAIEFTPLRVCAVIPAKQSERTNPVMNRVVFVSHLATVFAGMPAFAGATVERWNSPQKRPAVHLDVLPGDEARVGTAEEAHGGGDVGGLAAPADQRVHERVMLRQRLPRRARRRHQPRRHRVDADLVG